MNKLHGCIAVLIILAGFGFFIFKVTSIRNPSNSPNNPQDKEENLPTPFVHAEITPQVMPVCIVTLGYLTNEKPNTALKMESSRAISDLRNTLLSGTKGIDIVSLVQHGLMQDPWRKTVIARIPKDDTTVQKSLPKNPYEKFSPSSSINRCFSSTIAATEAMGSVILENNPTISDQLTSIKPGSVSDPIELTMERSTGKMGYGYMIISFDKE
jgi:hypothetical protein